MIATKKDPPPSYFANSLPGAEMKCSNCGAISKHCGDPDPGCEICANSYCEWCGTVGKPGGTVPDFMK